MNSDGLIDRIEEISEGMSGRNFAQKAGLSSSTFRSVKNGASPTLETLLAICRAAGVNIGWLATGEGSKYPNDAISAPNNEYVGIPRINAHLSAGNGHWNEESVEVLDHIPFTQEFLGRKLGRTKPDGLIILEADGDSMSPTIENGDLIMVDQKSERITEGIFAFLLNDMALIKRLRRTVRGDMEIISDNPIYDNEILNSEELQNFSLIGKVVWTGHHFPR